MYIIIVMTYNVDFYHIDLHKMLQGSQMGDLYGHAHIAVHPFTRCFLRMINMKQSSVLKYILDI